MTAREKQLAAENADLKHRNERQTAKIEELNRTALTRLRQIKALQHENDKHLDSITAMERANERLVEETIALRAAARPLLTDSEDNAGTAAMREIELRGRIS